MHRIILRTVFAVSAYLFDCFFGIVQQASVIRRNRVCAFVVKRITPAVIYCGGLVNYAVGAGVGAEAGLDRY